MVSGEHGNDLTLNADVANFLACPHTSFCLNLSPSLLAGKRKPMSLCRIIFRAVMKFGFCFLSVTSVLL